MCNYDTINGIFVAMDLNRKKLTDTFKQMIDRSLPGNSIDCVIFGYHEQQLKILLLQWKVDSVWSLPGGFIYEDEDMDEAAHRILSERIGLNSIFLSQFQTFGSKERSKLKDKQLTKRHETFIKEFYNDDTEIINWFSQRFITTGYFALVNFNETNPKPDFMSKKFEWVAINDLPELMRDHSEIIQKAIDQLRIQLNYLPIGMELLPKKFTMQDLQRLYEAILQTPLERSNFQRKILKLGFLNRHEKQMTGASNKAPYLYSFDKTKYNQLLKKGIGFAY